jgi:hypothetical protein
MVGLPNSQKEIKMENQFNEVLVLEQGMELTRRQSYANQAILRTGETRLNNEGKLMCVDEYNSSTDVWVRFINSGYMVNVTWGSFNSGSVKDVYHQSVYGVGYLGEGDYKAKINGKATPQYEVWKKMLQRCYSDKFQEKNPTYKGCSVDESWHNFQVFAKFYDDNFYQIEGQRMNIEKDILIRGNKIYSPETCVFVPQNINLLFTKRGSQRGDLPIGVIMNGKKYLAQCNNGTRNSKKYLGIFDTVEEAFQAYKTYKEQLIKERAEQYKGLIPVNLYNALMNYEIQIND